MLIVYGILASREKIGKKTGKVAEFMPK